MNNQQELSQIMQNDSAENVATKQPTVTAETIRQATGVNIPAAGAAYVDAPSAPYIDGMIIMSPSENTEFTGGQKIDDDYIMAEQSRKVTELVNSKDDEILNLMEQAVTSEESRLETVPEVQEKADDAAPSTESNIERNGVDSQYTDEGYLDTDDLVPMYSLEDAEEVDVEDKPEVISMPTNQEDSEEAFRRELKDMEIIDLPTSEDPIVKLVRDRSAATITSVESQKVKTLGDQAFLNAINKFKKDNFRTVQVPMINSGFTAEILGTGAVELTMLYSTVDEETSVIDYEIEKMKTILHNVVGTNPRISPESLKDMIHYNDYQMLAFGHLCATLAEVSTAHNCDECGKSFRINANPADLIINRDDLNARIEQIRTSTSVKELSLLSIDKKVETESGFSIVVGHPSYVDMINLFSAIKQYSTKMDKNNAKRFSEMSKVIAMVRYIMLPNGVKTVNAYQMYLALTMLSNEDYAAVVDVIDTFSKQAIIPQFGIPKAKCPYCGKTNVNIPYEKLDDIVFFHSMVTRLTK